MMFFNTRQRAMNKRRLVNPPKTYYNKVDVKWKVMDEEDDKVKLISWNVNGLRAVVGKGFVDIFNELGLTIPKTMDEMWGVCDKLVEAGIQPFSFPDKKAVRINQQFDRMLIGCVDHDF